MGSRLSSLSVLASLKSLRDGIVWTGSNDDLVASGRNDTSASRARVTPHVIRTVRILVVGVGIADEVKGTVCSEIHTYCRMLLVFLVPQFYQIILVIRIELYDPLAGNVHSQRGRCPRCDGHNCIGCRRRI